MGMFDNNADYGASGYLRREGDFFVVITGVEYNDEYFPKYKILTEVAAGSHSGEKLQGQVAKPTEKYMTDNDRSLGGFSFSQIGAYVVGAGITDEVNALEKMTAGIILKMLVGKTLKVRSQLSKKSQLLAEQGETAGLFYEIGKIYKRSEWKLDDIDAVPNTETPAIKGVDESDDEVSF